MKGPLNRLLRAACHGLLFCLCLLTFAACTPDTIKVEGFQADAQSVRQAIPLSGTWKFKPGGLQSAEADDSSWTDIKVPANWYLEGHDISGVAWYKKHFVIPVAFDGKRVSLNSAASITRRMFGLMTVISASMRVISNPLLSM